MNTIADIRKDYILHALSETDVVSNPMNQFTKWWAEAIDSKIEEVNAMTLATATRDGKPSARIVLLKGIDKGGFEFYTNYESQKGQEMAENENVALVIFWKELERQIRIEGTVAKLSATDSDNYFLSRPMESQLGAWSSPQSSVIANRNILEENLQQTIKKFEQIDMVRPPFWGGYIVSPNLIEFWQGRASRLHDRIEYKLENNKWVINRLAP
jgi:pyridoxamine 5'-phosphate oxidase